MKPTEILAHLAEMGTPPDPEIALKISVGLDGAINRLKSETIPFLAAGGSELQFVFAPYGRGKTHFLRAIEEVARQQGLVTAYVDCRTGQSPFRSFLETYGMAAAALTVASNDGLYASRNGVTAVIEERILDLTQRTARRLLDDIQQDSHLAADYRNLVYAYGASILQNHVRPDVKEELEALLTASTTYQVTLGKLYRTHPQLPRPIGKLGRRNAGLWLRSLLSLPRALKYQGLVILFDETEWTHSFSRLSLRSQLEHLANLRNFVDYLAAGAFHGCAIYYAVAADFIELARERLGALSQRIERVRLEKANASRNLRAVWASLDELTDPSPDEPEFFEKLAERIVDVSRTVLPPVRAERMLGDLKGKAQEYADIINIGAVREFVKVAANLVAAEVARHG